MDLTVLRMKVFNVVSPNDNEKVLAPDRVDEFVGEAPRMLPHAKLRELSRLRSWRNTLQIIFEWSGIALAIYLCEQHWHPLLYIAAIMWIGGRQHGLGILMHDAAHSHLYKNKRMNEIVGELFLAWPLLLTLCGYRRNHMAHHRHLNTEQDPEWLTTRRPEFVFPKSRLAMAWLIVHDLIGLRIAYLLFRFQRYGGKKEDTAKFRPYARRLTYLLIAVAFVIWPAAFRLYLIYWLVPGLTWVALITHLRVIGEHCALPQTHFLNMTRTTVGNWFDRLFIAPNNINYHLDHHLYPSVPWYNLPELHQILMEHPTFGRHAHVTYGYWRLIGECLDKKQDSEPERISG